MSLYRYRRDFFSYQQSGAMSSARNVVPLLIRALRPETVLDVGCGAGAWVRAWLDAGVADVWGIDADYVRPEQLLFPPSHFRAVDVGAPFDFGRAFDLVQCLEVAEHLDPASNETLVDNLVMHAPVVLFSAAPPGQGGEHHVNERPYEYWRGLFARRGLEAFDYVRPLVAHRAGIEPWYRYNILLFARAELHDELDAAVAVKHVPAGQPIADHSPFAWRMRRHALSWLPVPAISALAVAKHRLFLAREPRQRP